MRAEATMSRDAVAAYRSSNVTTADPVTLVVMLFEGALKAVRKARIHHEAGDLERYANEVERATLIIGELLTALDQAIRDGMAKSRNEFLVTAVRSQLAECRRAKIDAAFEAMATCFVCAPVAGL